MVIVGFDPGLATLGYGVIEVNNNSVKMLDYGAVITPKEDSLPLRLEKIEKGVVDGYSKIEDKFVETYLTREGETVEDAKARLKKDSGEE